MSNRLATLTLIAGASVTMASGPVRAGDWDGPSLSVGGGYGMTNNQFGGSLTEGPLSLSEKINGIGGSGGFVTIGAGYDRSLFDTLVVGAFVDYDFSDIDTTLSSASDPFSGATASAGYKIENQLSIGGRFGYLVSPATLFFTTFGYARVETSDITASGDPDFSGTLGRLGTFNGYFIGGGVETLLSNGFSVKAEYRYTSLRTETIGLPSDVDSGESLTIKPQIQTARLSLNYRFGDGKTEPVDESSPRVTSSWTGAYIGAGSGYSIAKNDISASDGLGGFGPFLAGGTDNFGYDGGFISFTAGYDYQFRPRFVIGAFADADLSNLSYANSMSFSVEDATVSQSVRSDFKNILMVGGRLGFLPTPDTLLFASAGYANASLGDTRFSANVDAGELSDSSARFCSTASASRASSSAAAPRRESTMRSPSRPNTVISTSEVKA
jgi:outer membrane immunogenic protein